MMSYEEFRDTIAGTIRQAGKPLTWTEIRTRASLPQKFPNNQWVHRMEQDIHLVRSKDGHGHPQWEIRDDA